MSLFKKSLAKAKAVPTSTENKAPTAAANATQANAPATVNKQTEYQLYAAAIESDLAQLKTFADISDKATYKSEVLERQDYLGYINQYRLNGQNHHNKVLAWVFIWLVDLKRWDAVMDLLPLMIEQKQPLPTVFNTKHWAAFVIDQLYDDANYYLAESHQQGLYDIGFTLRRLIFVVKNQDWAGLEVVGGKLYAIAAKVNKAQLNLGSALYFAKIAQSINDKAGVKTLLKELQKMIKPAEPEQQTAN
ncbi:phage terminase small subunit [Pseudoalteromonas sp. KG3]|uniref:phage terminase small subunit n=1 Tax=Pseudoalteromonas sp. KG3 TaxID=2951137 RepID=UPI002658A853|nr:phage terminase small subunit [Pseudoalteromonas sp. KG3]WKD23608.1 phage terminase small subunit [Pseudoalteromonas sp. KG3]